MNNKKKVRLMFPFAVARFNPGTGDWTVYRAQNSTSRISVLNASEEAAWADAWKNLMELVRR
jgi:hypothetical protein